MLNLPAINSEKKPTKRIVIACFLVITFINENPNTPVVPINTELKPNNRNTEAITSFNLFFYLLEQAHHFKL